MPGKLNDANFKVTKVQEEKTGVIESFKQRLVELHQVNFGVTKNQEETQGVEAEGFFNATVARIVQALSEVVGIDDESKAFGGVQIIKRTFSNVLGVSEEESKTPTIQPNEVLTVAIQLPVIAFFFRSFIEVSGIIEGSVRFVSKFRTRIAASVVGSSTQRGLTSVKSVKEKVGTLPRFRSTGTFTRPFNEVSGVIDGRINNLSKFRIRVASVVVGTVENRSLKPIQLFKENIGVGEQISKTLRKNLSESIGVLSRKAYAMTFLRTESLGIRESSDVGAGKALKEAVTSSQDILFGATKQAVEAISVRSRASFFYRAVNLGEVVGLIDDRTVQPIIQHSSVIGVQDIRQSGAVKSMTDIFTGEQSVQFAVSKQAKSVVGTIGESDMVKTFGLIIRQSVGFIDQEVSKPIISFLEDISPGQEENFGVTKGISQEIGVSDTVTRVRTRVIKVVQSIGTLENRAIGLTRALTETISPEQPIAKSLRRILRETVVSSDFDQLRVIKNPVVQQVRAVGSNILTILDSGLSRFRVFNTVNVQWVLNPRNQIMIFDQAREVKMERSENSVKTLDRQNDVETFDEFNES